MSEKTITSLTSSRPLFISIILGYVFWIISTVGVFQESENEARKPDQKDNKFQPILFFYLAYTLFILLGFTFIIATGRLFKYRIAALAYTSVSFSFCLLAVQVLSTEFTAATYLASIGFFFFTFVLFFWLLTVGQLSSNAGSGPDTALVDVKVENPSTPSIPYDTNPFATRQRLSQFLSSGDESDPISANNISTNSASTYKLKAEAIYSYQGNNEDSTELTFTKGEILDVGDTTGKWWPARNASGVAGIVPSNYLKLL